jgi:hypothetical protein
MTSGGANGRVPCGRQVTSAIRAKSDQEHNRGDIQFLAILPSQGKLKHAPPPVPLSLLKATITATLLKQYEDLADGYRAGPRIIE